MTTPEQDSQRPEISVVIPTRNRRTLLRLASASVLDQQGVHLEVIVIDEGSTDDTAAVVRALADQRLRLVRHELPLGKSAARNRGIAEARGEWIAFLDDDDIWAPEKLQLQLHALRSTGRNWAYTGAVNITADHRILGGAPPRPPDEVAARLCRVNAVPGGCSSVVVRRAALPAGGFDGQYRLCEDWDLWIRLARHGPPACVPRPLVGYRVHGGNSSIDTARFLVELDLIERQYGGPVDRVVFYRHLARVCLRMNRQWPAFRFYLRAAAHDRRSYLTKDFAADSVGVLRALRQRVERRLGGSGPGPRPAADEHSSWKAEAEAWLQPFVRRHAPENRR